jgi:hypothetical protein
MTRVYDHQDLSNNGYSNPMLQHRQDLSYVHADGYGNRGASVKPTPGERQQKVKL